MRKGFALLETLIVITFLSVSLLLLYGTFKSMYQNSEKNILYDDASNIYQVYYLKEYLNLNGLKENIKNEDVQVLSCQDFSFASCNQLFQEMNIKTIYLTKYNLNNVSFNQYSSSFNNYIHSLSNKGNYTYRLIVEFQNHEELSYASIGVNDYE